MAMLCVRDVEGIKRSQRTPARFEGRYKENTVQGIRLVTFFCSCRRILTVSEFTTEVSDSGEGK